MKAKNRYKENTMKKAVSFFITALLTICVFALITACGNNDNKTETPTKRIIGLDSEKTYVKGKFYIEHQNAVDGKAMYLDVLSYDKIEKDEIEEITFDISYIDIPPIHGDDEPQKVITELKCEKFELKFGEIINKDGYYKYLVCMYLKADKIINGFKIDSINMKIAGREYKFSSEIVVLRFNNSVYVTPEIYSTTSCNPIKGNNALLINVPYEMELKNLQFQNEGFEILSYHIEYFAGYGEEGNFLDGETVSEKLPCTLKANKTYLVCIEAAMPDDCLYYSNDLRAVMEIQGVEIVYSNIEENGGWGFKGSAVSSDFDEDAHE